MRTAAEGAPQVSWAHWEGQQTLVLGLLQGPVSGVQASLKGPQTWRAPRCEVSLGEPTSSRPAAQEGQTASSSSDTFTARIRLER